MYTPHMIITEPQVGMGVTYGIGGDSYPYTITKVHNYRRIEVAYDAKAGREEIVQDVSHLAHNATVITLRKNGKWIPEGQPIRDWGLYHIGYRMNRMDPSF